MADKSRTDRMRSIEALAGREGQALGAQMERQAETVRVAEARLAELVTCLAGYGNPPGESGTQGATSVSAMQLTETHLFLERLRSAVAAQTEVVEQARSGYESCRARWIAQRVRTTALGSVVHRFEQEEVRTETLREQRTQDETAARYHQQGLPGGRNGTPGGSD